MKSPEKYAVSPSLPGLAWGIRVSLKSASVTDAPTQAKRVCKRSAVHWTHCVLALILTALPLKHTLAADKSPAAKTAVKPISGPAGAWNGTWDVTRDHPQITTKGGAQALELRIRHPLNSASPRVEWVADRGLCDSPTAPPCEWIGERGVASSARVVSGHLLIVMHVSADESDPLVVWLERPQEGRSRGGTLISARGALAYRLDADRQ